MINKYKNKTKKNFSYSVYKVIFIFILILCFLSCNVREKSNINIRFWNGFTGPDGRTMLRIIKKFNKENPDVQITMQRIEWGTYYNKLFVAGLNNRAPEVFVIHAGNIERFMLANFLREVDDLINGPEGFDQNDIYENVWSSIEKNGKHFGVPLDVHILGAYYNKTLLKKNGIVDDKGEPSMPLTKDEFLNALMKITKDTNGDGNPDVYGIVYTWMRTNVYTIMKQWEGEFFAPDNSKCIINNKQNVEALQFCVDLIQKYKVAPMPRNFDAWIGFRQGKVAIAFEGIYMLEDIKKQKDIDYAGSPLPLLGKKNAAWADSHVLCIKNGIDEKTAKAAWKFIKYLSENSLDWAEGGQIPVRKSLRETERFQNMKIQYEFAKQIPYICYVPRVPFIFEFLSEFDIYIDMALRGSLTPEKALKTAEDNVNKMIARNIER